MKAQAGRGFSLLELLVVMAIIALMAALVVPAATTMLRGNQLTRAGDQVVALLSLARQTALSKNHTVEVRFYRFGDPDSLGENPSDPASGRYRAVQAFEINGQGSVSVLSKYEVLPPTIMIDSGERLSTLLKPSQIKTWVSDSSSKISLPRVGLNYECCAFRFYPDGSTNLARTTPPLWFCTLTQTLDGDNRTELPANFTTVQIDPVNGTVKIWRP